MTDAWGRTRWVAATWVDGQLLLSSAALDGLAPGTYTLTAGGTCDRPGWLAQMIPMSCVGHPDHDSQGHGMPCP